MQLFEPPNAVYLTEAFSSTRAASAQSGSPKGEKKIPWFPGGPNQVARQGPWETNSAGDASRLRQDLASGALHYVAERAKLKNNARHVVNAALRKGVCNAYAAYVSQVRIYLCPSRSPCEHPCLLVFSPHARLL